MRLPGPAELRRVPDHQPGIGHALLLAAEQPPAPAVAHQRRVAQLDVLGDPAELAPAAVRGAAQQREAALRAALGRHVDRALVGEHERVGEVAARIDLASDLAGREILAARRGSRCAPAAGSRTARHRPGPRPAPRAPSGRRAGRPAPAGSPSRRPRWCGRRSRSCLGQCATPMFQSSANSTAWASLLQDPPALPAARSAGIRHWSAAAGPAPSESSGAALRKATSPAAMRRTH